MRLNAAVTSLAALTIFSSLESSIDEERFFFRVIGSDSVDEEGSARLSRRRARSAF